MFSYGPMKQRWSRGLKLRGQGQFFEHDFRKSLWANIYYF